METWLSAMAFMATGVCEVNGCGHAKVKPAQAKPAKSREDSLFAFPELYSHSLITPYGPTRNILWCFTESRTVTLALVLQHGHVQWDKCNACAFEPNSTSHASESKCSPIHKITNWPNVPPVQDILDLTPFCKPSHSLLTGDSYVMLLSFTWKHPRSSLASTTNPANHNVFKCLKQLVVPLVSVWPIIHLHPSNFVNLHLRFVSGKPWLQGWSSLLVGTTQYHVPGNFKAAKGISSMTRKSHAHGLASAVCTCRRALIVMET